MNKEEIIIVGSAVFCLAVTVSSLVYVRIRDTKVINENVDSFDKMGAELSKTLAKIKDKFDSQDERLLKLEAN